MLRKSSGALGLPSSHGSTSTRFPPGETSKSVPWPSQVIEGPLSMLASIECSFLFCVPASIHDETGSGHVSRAFGSQKECSLCDLSRGGQEILSARDPQRC